MLYLYFGYVGSLQSLAVIEPFYGAVNHVRFYSWDGAEIHCGITPANILSTVQVSAKNVNCSETCCLALKNWF